VKSPNKNVAGLILAAGASERMGHPKALLPYQGDSFLDRLLHILLAHCSPVVVVLGYHAASIREHSRLLARARVVENPSPKDGQLSSLQCGLLALDATSAGVIFCPVDFPAVASATVRRVAGGLASLAREKNDSLLVIPRFEGKRGHPVGVRRELFAEFLSLPRGGRASDVIHRHLDETLYVDVQDAGIHRDIDNAADYQRLLDSETLP
jgi:molybdenum cofactor cytidylyltransferase